MKLYYHKQELDGKAANLTSIGEGIFKIGNLTLRPKYGNGTVLFGFDVVDNIEDEFDEPVTIKYHIDKRTECLNFINEMGLVVLQIGSVDKSDPPIVKFIPIFYFYPENLLSKKDSLVNLIVKRK